MPTPTPEIPDGFVDTLGVTELITVLDRPPGQVTTETGAVSGLVQLLPQLHQLRDRLSQRFRISPAVMEPRLMVMGKAAVIKGQRTILISRFVMPPIADSDYHPVGASVAYTPAGAEKINAWAASQPDEIVYDAHIHPDGFRDRNGFATFSTGDMQSILQDYANPAGGNLDDLGHYTKLGFLVAYIDTQRTGAVEMILGHGATDGLWTRQASVQLGQPQPRLTFRETTWHLTKFST